MADQEKKIADEIADKAKETVKDTAKAAVQIAAANYAGAAKSAVKSVGGLAIKLIACALALIILVLYLLLYPSGLFIVSDETASIQDEYQKSYQDVLDKTETFIRRGLQDYIDDVAWKRGNSYKNSYKQAGSSIRVIVNPNPEDYSLTERAANNMMAAYHVLQYYKGNDVNDFTQFGQEYDDLVREYTTDRNSSMFSCSTNQNVRSYEVVLQPEIRQTVYEEQTITSVATGKEYTITVPKQVVVQPEVRETRYSGTITVNVKVNTENFLMDELNAIAKEQDGSVITNSNSVDYLFLTPDDATPTQQKIYVAARSTPTTQAGYCALWVTNVFSNADIPGVGGDACDMWASYCHSSDTKDLKIGMIVAVKSTYTALGSIYGHVGIYIGNGEVIDSTGTVKVQSLESWIGQHDALGTVAWGYPPSVSSIIEREESQKRNEDGGQEDLSDTPSRTETVDSKRIRDEIVKYAREWEGITPYKPGGTSLSAGTDSAGFIRLIYKKFGINVSGSARDYADQEGPVIEAADVLPGDIVVYGNGAHVGIYIGKDKLIHCCDDDSGTRIDKVTYRDDPPKYVRVINDNDYYELSTADTSKQLATKSTLAQQIKNEIKDVAENIWLEFGNTGEDYFTKYAFDEETLNWIAWVCYNTQKSAKGAAMEASYMANRYEIQGKTVLYGFNYGSGEDGLLNFIQTSGYWKTSFKNAKKVTPTVLDAVRKVLVDGCRVLPLYVDRKISFGSEYYTADRSGEEIDPDKSYGYVQFMTNIHPVGYANGTMDFTFYCFAPTTHDLYGYSSEQIRHESGEGYFTFNTWIFMGETEDFDESKYANIRDQVVAYAKSWVQRTPYVFWTDRVGVGTLETGTDCSGFVYLIFQHFGINASPSPAPYLTPEAAGIGTTITRAQLKPGDVIVYGELTATKNTLHVVLYAGDGMVVSCSSPENGTVYCSMDYRSDIAGYARIIDDSLYANYMAGMIGSASTDIEYFREKAAGLVAQEGQYDIEQAAAAIGVSVSELDDIAHWCFNENRIWMMNPMLLGSYEEGALVYYLTVSAAINSLSVLHQTCRQHLALNEVDDRTGLPVPNYLEWTTAEWNAEKDIYLTYACAAAMDLAPTTNWGPDYWGNGGIGQNYFDGKLYTFRPYYTIEMNGGAFYIHYDASTGKIWTPYGER